MPLAAIAVLSAGALAYEVLLTRLFAIFQWHHFAYMVISIALLGYGASGTLLAFTADRLRPRFEAAFAACAALFGVTAVACFALAQGVPFNPLAIMWDPRQALAVAALYLLLTVPFLCAATGIGLALACLRERIARVYRADLLGAGTGALAVVAALFAAPPQAALGLVGAAGLAAAAIACARRPRRAGALALAAAAVAAAAPTLDLRLSEYKGLSRALLVPGAEVVAERSSPLGLVTVVANERVPLRHAPGLSLASRGEPPAQLAVFTDGEGPSAITAFDGSLEPLAYLGDTTAAAPYHLLESPAVLVLGAGGGADVLQALYHGARSVDAVELDPAVIALVAETFADFAGQLYADPRVRVHVAEARGFVTTAPMRYDLIQVPLLDSFAAASVGTRGLAESTIYTVEAVEQYLAHLAPGGVLAITRWLKIPPRDSLKLFATAIRALEQSGGEPAKALAMIRSWSTVTVLVKDGALGEDEVAALGELARSRSFDLAYYPGMGRDEANRRNVLDEPYFYDGAVALLGPDRDSFVARYKFAIAPATDDRPYFFDFFRWRALPELIATRVTGAALLDWGTVILAATLVQVLVLSVALILLPLAFRRARARAGERWPVGFYFLAIGLAFLFVEIASIQRFVLFLSHPLYALAVVLAAFLVFAGLGSGAAPRLEAWVEARWRLSALDLAIGGIVATALVYLLVLPPLFRALMPLADAAKVALSIALIAPLAFWMGMPFPLALARVSRRLPELVPWAWGVNGCASVVSAVLAALLAMSFGFSAVVLAALTLYVAAALAMRAAPC